MASRDTPAEVAYLAVVASRIKGFRKSRGLSMERLAGRAEISRETLRLVEDCGRSPTLQTCLRIANVLEVPISALVSEA